MIKRLPEPAILFSDMETVDDLTIEATQNNTNLYNFHLNFPGLRDEELTYHSAGLKERIQAKYEAVDKATRISGITVKQIRALSEPLAKAIQRANFEQNLETKSKAAEEVDRLRKEIHKLTWPIFQILLAQGYEENTLTA